MFELVGTFFELSILVIGAVSAVLGILASLLALSRKYADAIKPIVNFAKLFAVLFLFAPAVLCLFGDPMQLESNMTTAGTLYSLFSIVWLVVFVLGSIAYLVNLPGQKDSKNTPPTLYISALFFLVISVLLGWLFS